jgi:hypothetical protein
MRALEIRIQNRFLQLRIAHAPAKLVRQHRHLSGRIDDHLREKPLTRAVRQFHLDTNCAIAFKQNLLHEGALMDHHATISSVINQQLIELSAVYLPRHRALMMHRLEKVERPRLLPCRIGKLHAVLAHKRAVFEFLEQTHAPESPVSVGHQRLTDVMPRKHFFLKQDHLPAFAL